MSELFYTGEKFTRILRLSDSELQEQTNSISKSAFPDIIPKVFRTDIKLRRRVIALVSRFLSLYGYAFATPATISRIKAIKRESEGIIVGLYNPINYQTVERMLIFLNRIDMNLASSLVFLAICDAMNRRPTIKTLFEKGMYAERYFATQYYLVDFITREKVKPKKPKVEKSKPAEPKKQICPFTGLNYTGNSCYQDSALLALFAIPNSFIDKNILNKDVGEIKGKCQVNILRSMQGELRNITNSMRTGDKNKYCSNLRAIIAKCPAVQKFHGTGTQDAGEFVQYLFDRFKIPDISMQRSGFLTNDLNLIPKDVLKSKKIIETSSPIVTIDLREEDKSVKLSDFLVQETDTIFDEYNSVLGRDGNYYRRRVGKTEILDAEYLIFYSMRLKLDNRGKEKRYYNEIYPDEKIRIPNSGRILNLHAIVVHRSVHYTCYIKCGETWFYYNDISNTIVPVGNFEKALTEKGKPNVKTEGVLYFYS